MAHAHPRTPLDRGGISLYLRRWSQPAAAVLALFISGVPLHGQTPSFRNSRDLLVGGPTALRELLEAARPSPLSKNDIEAVLKALPSEGTVATLEPAAREKVDAVRQLLTATRRDWYEVRVIDVPQAAIVLYARAVVLISAPAVALVSAAELQALTAHEIGHEYVWMEWNRAHQDANQERLKDLELVCDAIAAVTLHELGIRASRLIDALEKMSRYNRNRFGTAINQASHPTMGERRAFARRMALWDSSESGRHLATGEGLPRKPQSASWSGCDADHAVEH